MDRIDTSLLSSLTLKPTGRSGGAQSGPREIDPSPRLRVMDRRDTVELGGQPLSRQFQGANPLVAGTVANAPSIATVAAASPAARTVAANAAMRLYASPADQNAAATRLASNAAPGAAPGSMLDITA